MLIIPAIDLKEGKCVRLWQGLKKRQTVYSDDPIQVAEEWIKKGATRIHIVDLDGAFSGKPRHLKVVESIKKSFPVIIQYGGGIRNLKILEKVLEKGIDFAIIGTKALSSRFIKEAVANFNQRIIVSIDCKNEKVAIKGWEVDTHIDAIQLSQNLADAGIKTLILTDIAKDGTLEGANISFIERFLKKVFCDIMVAGGISSLEDIKKIKKLQAKNLKGVIIGKALYSKTIDFKEALRTAK